MICAITYVWLLAATNLPVRTCRPPARLTHEHFECMTMEAMAPDRKTVILSARICFEKGVNFHTS